MNARNTARAYRWVARSVHWTVAVRLLAATGLGVSPGRHPQGH